MLRNVGFDVFNSKPFSGSRSKRVSLLQIAGLQCDHHLTCSSSFVACRALSYTVVAERRHSPCWLRGSAPSTAVDADVGVCVCARVCVCVCARACVCVCVFVTYDFVLRKG